MKKAKASRYSQFRARQRGEVLKAGDSLTAACCGESSVQIQNRATGKYLTTSGEWKKGGTK